MLAGAMHQSLAASARAPLACAALGRRCPGALSRTLAARLPASRRGPSEHTSARRVHAAVSQADEAAPETQPQPQALEVGKIDLRVGRILSVEAHPEADDLYVEQIDLGEPEPRTIVSGLKKYVTVEELEGRLVVVVSNLKPRKLRGVLSNGMLLCASNADHSVVDPVQPPEAAAPGERLSFGEGEQEAAASPNQVQKKKLWEACQPHLRTDAEGVAGFKGVPMMSSQGPVRSSLKDAGLS